MEYQYHRSSGMLYHHRRPVVWCGLRRDILRSGDDVRQPRGDRWFLGFLTFDLKGTFRELGRLC
jgi:hypothetical protein